MSAARPRIPGQPSPSRQAAFLYLRRRPYISLREAGEKFGVCIQSVHYVVQQLRLEGAASWPEDELSC